MTNIYETERLLGEYLLFHYGAAEEILPYGFGPQDALHFPVRSFTELWSPTPIGGRALDLGCAVGRTAFCLSEHFEEVSGIDYSRVFINAAERLRCGETLCYQRPEEGNIATTLTATRPAGNPERITFQVADAMALPGSWGDFDLVHAANLLCRLSDPKKLLERLPALVRPGGQLLLTTPCTWLAEFTPTKNWPPGRTLEWLLERLGASFDLELTRDLPFLIREHARKFQWSVALGMRWRRKAL